jgi:hypothetical protein
MHRSPGCVAGVLVAFLFAPSGCSAIAPHAGRVACDNDRQELCDRAMTLARERLRGEGIDQPSGGWQRIHVSRTDCSGEHGCLFFVTFEPAGGGALPVVELITAGDGGVEVVGVGHGDPVREPFTKP